MSRIVSAVNAMILNAKKIGSVIVHQDEYYFAYDNKHKWSITEENGDNIILRLYAKNNSSLDEIVSFRLFGDVPNTVSYSVREIGTREARQSFQELLSFIKEKALGVNEVLDEIISDADDDIPF